MAREKKPVHKVQMTEGKRNIIRQLLEEYDIESAQDMESIQQRIVENGKKGKATWLYIDEFHVLLNSEYSAKYLQQLWKKVRKQGGLCTGITQNVVDLLQNYTAMGTASRGAELFRRKALAEKRKRIKKVEAGKKLAKKTAKETAKTAAKEASKDTAKAAAKEGAKVAAKVGTTVAGTAAGAETGPYAPLIGIAVGKAVGDKIDKMDAQRNSRNRKIKFFLDKMKAEGEQQDSFAKLVKDLFVNKMALSIKKIMVAVGGFLLVLV